MKASNTRIAIDSTGRIRARVTLDHPGDHSYIVLTDVGLAWTDGENSDVLHGLAFGASADVKPWRVALDAPSTYLLSGKTVVAVRSDTRLSLYRLTDGGLARGSLSEISAFAIADDVVATLDAHGAISLIDAAGDKLLWSVKSELDPAGATVALLPGSVVVETGSRRDGTVVIHEYDRATGASRSPRKLVPKDTSSTSTIRLGSTEDGGALAALSHRGPDSVVRTDRAGLIVWSSKDWKPLQQTLRYVVEDPPASVHGEDGATMAKMIDGHHELIAFDAARGTLRWHRPLGDHATLSTVTGGCVVVLDLGQAQQLACLDAGTGALRWRRPLTGTAAVAWSSGDGIIAASGTSLDVVKLDPATGRVVWQMTPPEKPETFVKDGRLMLQSTDPKSPWPTPWVFGEQFAIVVDAQVAYLLDYASGKLAVVKL